MIETPLRPLTPTRDSLAPAKAAVLIDPLDLASDALAADGTVAIATVIETWGSAPVPIGGQMAIRAGGAFAGSVSGGCIEADVIAASLQAIADGTTRALTFGVANETAWRVGLPCGGKIRVLVERWSGLEDQRMLDAIAKARDRREACVVRTPVAGGHRLLLSPADLHGLVRATTLSPDLAGRLLGGDSRLAHWDGVDVFYKTYAPVGRIIIVGATHIGQILAEFADRVGFAVIVVDPRETYTGPDRFGTTPILDAWPQEALLKLGLDRYTAVVALAHVAHLDDEALAAALASDCRYVGALGSRVNHAKRIERLAARGFSPAQIARIHAPVGLDIGALTPAEIALAIMAEIVESVRGRKRP
jgi:xanthine dehydrogenase accessory factor